MTHVTRKFCRTAGPNGRDERDRRTSLSQFRVQGYSLLNGSGSQNDHSGTKLLRQFLMHPEIYLEIFYLSSSSVFRKRHLSATVLPKMGDPVTVFIGCII